MLLTLSLLLFLRIVQLPDYEALDNRLKMFMGQYNDQVRGALMDLVFFKDAMVHIMKVKDK